MIYLISTIFGCLLYITCIVIDIRRPMIGGWKLVALDIMALISVLAMGFGLYGVYN